MRQLDGEAPVSAEEREDVAGGSQVVCDFKEELVGKAMCGLEVGPGYPA